MKKLNNIKIITKKKLKNIKLKIEINRKLKNTKLKTEKK